MQTVHTSRDEASCGYDFTAGKEYLIYANGSAANLEVNLCSRTTLLATAVTDLLILGTGEVPGTVDPIQWLPTISFTLLGLLLIVSGLFASQLNGRLGWSQHIHPHLQFSASKTKGMGRIVLILFGAGLLIHGIGNGYLAYGILNLLTLLFWTLAIISTLILMGRMAYFWWRWDK